MKAQDNEILVYYNPASNRDKQVVAFAHSVAPNVREIAYKNTRFTQVIWRQILDKLELRPKDLMNRADPYYQDNIRGRDFNRDSWINILMNNPDLIKAPIVIKGDKAVLCDNPTDIYQL